MKKKKRPTVDAQRVKEALIATVKKIGKRKRMTAGAFFELICESMN